MVYNLVVCVTLCSHPPPKTQRSAHILPAIGLARLRAARLVKRVVAGSPVGQDQAEADGLKDACQSSNGDRINRALLGEDLRDELSGHTR